LGSAGALASVAIALAFLLFGAGAPSGAVWPAGLRVTVLDVGQGDAILLQPRGAPAVLVDGGPPGDRLAAKLRAAGVERLGAAIVTHDQSDHAGGLRELFGSVPVGQLLYGVPGRGTLADAASAGIASRRLERGNQVRSGRLRLEVLWPPPELLAAPDPGQDPNALALVVRARWHDFSMLLTADAEAEAVPLDPGPVDVLKVAHHGSDDAGLATLLDRARPELAVISVGSANPFGHPTPATLRTLAARGICVLRTDRDGPVAIDVDRDSTNLRIDIGAISRPPCRSGRERR
jgi:competence protein ComEC